MTAIIVAYDKNRAIGAHGQLPWGRSLPNDLQRFKMLTLEKTIIMGYRTFVSIGRALPGRRSIIVSHQQRNIEDALVVPSLEEAYKQAPHNCFIIGGGQIYTQALARADTVYATEIDASFAQTDTFFPLLSPQEWKETERDHFHADERNLYDYDFVTYQRIRQAT